MKQQNIDRKIYKTIPQKWWPSASGLPAHLMPPKSPITYVCVHHDLHICSHMVCLFTGTQKSQQDKVCAPYNSCEGGSEWEHGTLNFVLFYALQMNCCTLFFFSALMSRTFKVKCIILSTALKYITSVFHHISYIWRYLEDRGWSEFQLC